MEETGKCTLCKGTVLKEDKCDFCDQRLCEQCQDKEDISYHFCDECNRSHCWNFSRYREGPCVSQYMDPRCSSCGFTS